MAMSKAVPLAAVALLGAPAFLSTGPSGRGVAGLRGAAPAQAEQHATAASGAEPQGLPTTAVAAGLALGLGAAASGRRRRGAVRSSVTKLQATATRQLRPRDRTDGHGWIKEDPDFVDNDDSMVAATHTIVLNKLPSGIKRYTHGVDGKGAMVMEMNEKARYPGDPIGQAAVAGVKKGYVVKSINGTDVRGFDFEDIMDMLQDYVPDPDVQSTSAFGGGAGRVAKYPQVSFPVTIEYMELKEGAAKAAAPAMPAAPAGAWMPRLKPWTDQDLAQERARAMAMPDPPGYSGPRYTGPGSINDQWIEQLLAMQKTGGLLPKKDAYLIVLDMITQLRSEGTLNDITVAPGQSCTVFGDIHGQYFDFLNFMDMAGRPSPASPFLFNGDFVDRGSWSIEVIMAIFAMKLKTPGSVFLNRGNHEMLEANIIYGFAGETGAKYDMDLFNLFSEAFRNLPLSHLINKKAMVVHAGLPGPRPRVWLPGQTHDPEDAVPVNAKCVTLAEIAACDRYTELTPNSYKEAVDETPKPESKDETDQRMVIDFLWADPRGGVGYGPSYRKSRGVFMFGPDVTEQFCRENNLQLVIRSHEVKADGFLYDHATLMSVFSAPNYLDTGGNKGAFLKLSPAADGSLTVTPTSYTAVPHPALEPMHHQTYIQDNFPHLTRTMKKKIVSTGDDFGDSDFAGYQGPDEWEEA